MAEQDPSTTGRLVVERAERLVTELLDRAVVGVGPFAGAEQIAEEHVSGVDDVEQAIERLIRTHVRLAAGSGFVTSLGGFVTMPVTVPAGVGGLYLVAARLCAATAHLRGYPGKVLIEINKKVGYRLLTKFGQRGVINLAKLVPAVGGVIGATVDSVGCRSIAVYAKSTFPAIDRSRSEPIVVESKRVDP